MASPPHEITDLLQAWRGGDPTALDRLTPLVYDHLRRIARQYVRRDNAERRFDATGLVHDAYLRLVDARLVDWQDRAHFFAVTARIMRRILVDAARARLSAKRGGGFQRIDHSSMNLDELPAASSDRSDDICALNDALNALATVAPRCAQVVEMRFFGGLTVEETANALGVSVPTVMRDWRLARAWLSREMNRQGDQARYGKVEPQ